MNEKTLMEKINLAYKLSKLTAGYRRETYSIVLWQLLEDARRRM